MKKSVTAKLMRYIGKYKLSIVLSLLFALINVSCVLVSPVLIGDAIDNIIGEGNVNFAAVTKILIGVAVITVGASVFKWLMLLCTNHVAYSTVHDIRNQVYAKFNSVPLKYIDSHPHGDLISRVINDVDNIGDGLIQCINQLFSGVVTIVGTFVFMLSINFEITVIVVLITPLSLFVAAFIGRMSAKTFRDQAKTQGELSSFVEEMIGNQRIVKTFEYEDDAQETFEEINARLYKSGQKSQLYSSLANPCTRFVNAVVYAGVGVFGAISAVKGTLTVGQISCFLSYAKQYTKPFNEITSVVTQLQTAIASAGRIFEVLEADDQSSDEPGKELEGCKGNVDFDKVCFSYTPERELIKNFTLNVKSGQRVAIVGPTGCGKTTLINLLMRFYDTGSGTISIDGLPVNDIKRDSLRTSFGMVLQESWLYNATIRDNIAYGKPDATDEEIEKAAKASYAHSFIKRLPDGYDTVISEDGENLSQGQKQLLCIARVMLCNPTMLILDEATSSIDTLTEQRVQKAFAKLMKGKTSFIVAHRLSTIRDADMILVMRDGNIIEHGTHDELLKQGGFYKELYFAGSIAAL